MHGAGSTFQAEFPACTVYQTAELSVLPEVLEILRAAFAAHDGIIDPPSGAHRENVASLAKKLSAETLLVARHQDDIAGCIWCLPSDSDVYIGRLAVAPERQGRGIASALLQASIAWARSRGASSMSLGVRVELTENIAFFERHGFRITRSESHAGYDRPTNYHMELALNP